MHKQSIEQFMNLRFTLEMRDLSYIKKYKYNSYNMQQIYNWEISEWISRKLNFFKIFNNF